MANGEALVEHLAGDEGAEFEASPFVRNIMGDLGELLKGAWLMTETGRIYEAAKKLGMSPEEFIATQKQETEALKGLPMHLLKTPLRVVDPEEWYERPVSTGLDLASLLTLGTVGALKAPAIGRVLGRGTVRGLGGLGRALEKAGFAEPLAQRRAGMRWIPKAEAGAKVPHESLGMLLDPEGQIIPRTFERTGFVKPPTPPRVVPKVVETTSFGGKRMAALMGPDDMMLVAVSPAGEEMGFIRFTKEPGGFTSRQTFVKPGFRRQGVVTELYRRAMEEAGGPYLGATARTEMGEQVHAALRKSFPKLYEEKGAFSTKDIRAERGMSTSRRPEVRLGKREAKATPAEQVSREGRLATKYVLGETELTMEQVDQLRALPKLISAFPEKEQARIVAKLAKNWGIKPGHLQYLIDLAAQ